MSEGRDRVAAKHALDAAVSKKTLAPYRRLWASILAGPPSPKTATHRLGDATLMTQLGLQLRNPGASKLTSLQCGWGEAISCMVRRAVHG